MNWETCFGIGLILALAGSGQSAERQPGIVPGNQKNSIPSLVKDGKRVRVSKQEYIAEKLKAATGKYAAIAVPDG